ncbi:1-deoxy-D-xylulose-5-phosphate reductoisomerase [Propionimicrobium lymphophilum]|uniref:1-deoxy-D-xylulose-5-phosphate reductoisomerase n=1 Tax=Propionimicrobium lymphophilum TaxID=33012 RepID=UPI000428D9C7|nr:1-deoxy-D-xylulose-5-phosphate reductoisomerase [Propionimicrobium lymphophilum]
MRSVVLLGSTGSIGTQTLEVIGARRSEFMIDGLAAYGSQPELLAKQVYEFRPQKVAITDEKRVGDFWAAYENIGIEEGLIEEELYRPEVISGENSTDELAAMDTDIVLNAVTGAAGLTATLATLKAGTTLALANKESLVIGGKLVTEAAAEGQLVAVDSEHSAFAQCLRGGRSEEVSKLILTASGGPFRGKTRDELKNVSVEEAMAHPTWNMGRVITINSSTLVNKGLELIEAALLYDVDFDQIQVVVHPQSMVHSGVEFNDGALICQASPPDMKLPIGLALTWPNRMPEAARPVDWSKAQEWTFEPLDNETFPSVELARKAGKASGSAPAVYNAANEVCVDAFCEGKIGFLDISDILGKVLDDHLANGHVSDEDLSLESVLDADAWARGRASEIIESEGK